RDLGRNNPIAAGAKQTSKSNVVGSGLRVRSKLNPKLLGLSPEAAELWERKAETLFDLWAQSKLCDITLTQNFYELQGLVFNAVFESGDTFVLRRTPKRPNAVVPLALNVIEADRVATPSDKEGDYLIRDGVKIDEDGAPVSYFVLNEHPGERPTFTVNGYAEVPAFGKKSGEQMVLHIFERLRPGLNRGIPQLAPVIEILKQLDRYSEAELMKAVVSSFFTVFLKTAGDDGLASATPGFPGMGANDVTMGPGTIVDIGTDEEIQTAQPANTANFDPFFQSVVRQITADTVLENLKADGIDASGVKGQIADAIKNNQGNHAGLSAAITKAVQGAIGSSSAVDADKISESVNDAVAAAGSKVDITKFMTDLKKKMDDGVATTGDIAQILEARHISRYMALLKADLPAMIKEVEEKSDGYSQKQYKIANQGLPAVLLKLGAAWEKFRNTIVDSVGNDIANAFTKLADTLQKLSETNPALLKTGVYFAAAAAAAGPLLFVLGALGRVGLLAMRGLNLAVLGMLLPFRLLAGVIAGVGVVAVGRLAAMALGFRMLTALGAGATLSALGGSLLALGRAILLFPLTALRAIGLAMWALVANPVGLIITALVVALTALSVWVYNNWAGIKEFFAGFGKGFMEGLGPAGPAVKAIADGLGSVYNWMTQLLGPLDATNAKWREWGETVGGVAASGVRSVISAIQSLIGFFGTAIDKAMSLGSAIKGIFSSGGGGKGAPAGGAAPAPIAGARAMGGPVSFGKPYLVGEQGPELFVPGMSGRIEPNDTLRRLTSDGASAVASSSENNTTVSRSNTAQITVQVQGGNPNDVRRAAEDAVYAAFARLESEQRGLLSD
ncbi:capsid protein, partial [Bradyrhizobium diazoefficiens]